MLERFSKWLDTPVFKTERQARIAIAVIPYALILLCVGTIVITVLASLKR